MNKEEMFSSLVENAFDFLNKALSELKNDAPKYSVIHFYAAVELFVKARLMHEHWSLVITKKQEPDWESFVKGDFQSVSLEEAASRLKKIVCSGLSQSELDVFKEVAKHRNKMVHFFHKASSPEENDKFINKIVREQLKAWYFLHQLLTNKWEKEFSSWEERISEIDLALRKLHEFLKVVFENLSEEIKLQKEKGVCFRECPSCGFESQRYESLENIIYESKCLVCGLSEKNLNIKCPECRTIMTIFEEESSCCQSCEYELEPKDIEEALIDHVSSYIAAKDGDGTLVDANCSECGGYHTVISTKNDKWICSQCHGMFDSLDQCQWCNEYNTGNMESSRYFGCNFCDGYSGWHNDKDD